MSIEDPMKRLREVCLNGHLAEIIEEAKKHKSWCDRMVDIIAVCNCQPKQEK